MTKIGKRFLAMLGVHDRDYEPGDIIVIRGKHYCFPSWTHMFDATRGHLGDYRVEPGTKPLFQLDETEDTALPEL